VYAQEQVHDFAWTASNDYTVDSDTCRLPSGKTINVYAYYTHRSQIRWKNCLTYLKAALRFYAAEVGEYPYAAMTLAESGATAAGGMEYPALAIISAPPSEKAFDLLIAHETGHMWFYGALATNEREAPWMDEGLNTFYERKYAERHYGQSAKLEELLLQTSIKQKKRPAHNNTRSRFSLPVNYALVAYYKTTRWLAEVEKSLGTQPFQEQMQAYYKQWQNKHPQHEEFEKVFSARASRHKLMGTDSHQGITARQTAIRLQYGFACCARHNKAAPAATHPEPALGKPRPWIQLL
jgi:aminopeptidase N